jgi:hypothetical protein
MIHRLRIAASVFFAILAVLLCMLWVASNRRHISITGKLPGSYDFGIESLHGSTGVHIFRGNVGWNVAAQNDLIVTGQDGKQITRPHIFFYRRILFSQAYNFPTWFPLLICAAIATLPCFPYSRRFSLRTLLIATTLIAVLLGLIMWFAR